MLGLGGIVSEPTDPVIVCRECGSESVWAQATVQLRLNRPIPEAIPSSDLTWDDSYWCDQCQDDCKVTERDQQEGTP